MGKTTKQEPVFNFEVFKEQFKLFLNKEFDVCVPFNLLYDDVKDTAEIRRLFARKAEEVFESGCLQRKCKELFIYAIRRFIKQRTQISK